MKYILNQEEYDNLLDGIEKEKEAQQALIQKLCTEIANSKLIKFWGNTKAEVWGCILTDLDVKRHHGYCDECPAQDDCPKDFKEWSK